MDQPTPNGIVPPGAFEGGENKNQSPVGLSDLPGLIPTTKEQFPGPSPRGEGPKLKGKARIAQLQEIARLKKLEREMKKKNSTASPPPDTDPRSPVASVQDRGASVVQVGPNLLPDVIKRLRRHNSMREFRLSMRESGFYRWQNLDPAFREFAEHRFDQIVNDDFAVSYFIEKTIATCTPDTVHGSEKVCRSVLMMIGFATILEWWKKRLG